MNNWTNEEVEETVSLMTRKTINDFSRLELKEKDELHKTTIINNMSPADEEKHNYLIDNNKMKEELNNIGLTKDYRFQDDLEETYHYHSERSKNEAKELLKYKEIYNFSNDNNINIDKNLDYQYLKNDMIMQDFNNNIFTEQDLERIEKKAYDELYYPDLMKSLDKDFEELEEELSLEDKENIRFVKQKAEDVYLGIHYPASDYSNHISEHEVKRLYSTYDLENKFKDFENKKLNADPDLDKGVKKEIENNNQKYEQYVEKYYDSKNSNDFTIASSYLANRNLYTNVNNELNSERFNKNKLKEEIKDKEEINRFKYKDDEKIKKLKQDELYSKLVKQMQKNDLYLNSVNSNIAYKSRANTEHLSHSSAQLQSRDTMQKQTTIDKTESNVRSTINDTRTDNKVHKKKENKESKRNDDLER